MHGTCNGCDHSRAEWAAGPWDGEPDRVEFTHAGLQCLLHRAPLGHWCGYVGLPEGHAFFGVDAEEVPAVAHGGVNYSGPCEGPVCHVPPEGQDDPLWWIGFDCAHAGDVVPSMRHLSNHHLLSLPFGRYRGVDYVRKETEHLATQLAALGVPSC